MLQDIVKNYELIKGRTENTSEYVLTLANDKKVKVAKSYIDKNMKNLELDLEETLLMYLEDNIIYFINMGKDCFVYSISFSKSNPSPSSIV